MIILLAALLGFFGFPFGQQIPAFARDVLYVTGQTDTAVATRTSAMYMMQGIGALAAAFFLATFSGIKRRGLLMTIGQFAFIFALIGLSQVNNVPPALFLMLVLGWGMVTQLNLMNVLIQVNGPQRASRAGVQFLFMGAAGRGTLWQLVHRLDGAAAGGFRPQRWFAA